MTLELSVDMRRAMLGHGRMGVTSGLPALAFALAGCLNDGTTTEPGTANELVGSGPCSVDVDGSVPGVRIEISSDRCVFARGDSGQFVFRVTTTAEVPPIDVPFINGCTGMLEPRPNEMDVGAWVTWSLEGHAFGGAYQQYCLCDTGCGGGWPARTLTPPVGTHEQQIMWSGRTWQGPSDFGQGMGDYFRAGEYGLRVTFHGWAQGTVVAELPIVVLP